MTAGRDLLATFVNADNLFAAVAADRAPSTGRSDAHVVIEPRLVVYARTLVAPCPGARARLHDVGKGWDNDLAALAAPLAAAQAVTDLASV